MSLVSVALRLIATNLLKSKTWAEDQVLDMPLFPLNEIIRVASEDQKPVIAVFTPSSTHDPDGRDDDDGMQTVRFQIYVYMSPGKTTIENDDIQFTIDMTNVANSLAMVSRQAMNAIKSQGNEWSDLWSKFVVGYKEVSSDYILHEIEKGVPIPCYAISLEIMAPPEPLFGEELNPNWLALDAAIRTTEDGEVYADLLKGMIIGDEEIPDYDLFRRQYAMSKSAAIEMGINPVPDAVSEDETSSAEVETVDVVSGGP